MARQAVQSRQGKYVLVAPQPGFQTRFLSSPANIVIGGGAAGGGKSHAELLAPVKWIHLPDFRCVFFRRTMEQIRAPGGLWDESLKLYGPMRAKPAENRATWKWPSGALISMEHLQYDSTVLDWQGAQVALLIFDELTHFSSEQFWYLQSRNRSGCGVKPYTLATCNPDPDSWVAKLIEWWIDQETGLPIAARGGVLRWFTRVEGEIVWGSSRQEVFEGLPAGTGITLRDIQSLTFIPGTLDDNPRMVDRDPGYRGKLLAMTRVNRARLLEGNWKVRANAGSYFRRSDVRIIDQVPLDIEKWVRRWDLAASEPTEANPDPDWTCGIKLGRYPDGRFVVADCKLVRQRANDVRELVKRIAEEDGEECCIVVPQDPAQAGKDQAESYVRELAGYMVDSDRETGDKQTRVEPVAAQWQHGNIDVVRGPWNDAFFQQLEAFPDKNVHDDVPDALSGAFQACIKNVTMFDSY